MHFINGEKHKNKESKAKIRYNEQKYIKKVKLIYLKCPKLEKKKKYTNYNKIILKQKETKALAKEVELMIIVRKKEKYKDKKFI